MRVNLKRVFIILSICLNIGFILLGSYYYLKEQTERNYKKGFVGKEGRISFFRDLNLTPEQDRAIDLLLGDYFKKQSELKKSNKKLQNELLLIAAKTGEVEEKRLDQILEDIATTKRNREEATLRHLLMIKKTLNEEQANKMFSKLLSQMEREKE